MDPASRVGASTADGDGHPLRGGKRRQVPKLPQERLDHLVQLAKDLGTPYVQLSAADIDDLQRIDQLTQAESQIERLKEIEGQTVETEKWNHDCVVELLSLSLTQHEIPFGRREELFDLLPTADDPPPSTEATTNAGSSRKGKETAQKRSLYHHLPTEVKEAWLGKQSEGHLHLF